MSKYEKRFTGNFNDVLQRIDSGIVNGSFSASYEDGSNYAFGEIKCAVRVYERYSMIGSNRVSMNITLIANGNELFITAITSGGSQAVFFKINTFGEDAFLDKIIKIIEECI